MNEVNSSYTELLKSVENGQVTFSQEGVSYQTGPSVLEDALKNHDDPVAFRLFDWDQKRYVDVPFVVSDVEEFDDKRVYSVQAAEDANGDRSQFMVEHFCHYKHHENEVSLLTFLVKVEPVES